MPMTIQLPSGHRFRTDNARAIKLIEQGATQVDDDPTLEVKVAPESEVETATAPASTSAGPDLTKADLLDIAAAHDIPGRSSMSKAELVEAIAEAQD